MDGGDGATWTIRRSAVLWMVDVAVYLATLNLVEALAPQVITETFAASVVTAVLLKCVLEVVVALKDRLKGRLRSASSVLGRVTAAVGLWLLLVGSKFLVLELVDLVFGDRVSLGGFWLVTGLILVLMLARATVRLLVDRRLANGSGGLRGDDAPGRC